MDDDQLPLGRRDRKRLATHHALRSAALHLVAERGLHHVTVEEIADRADVSVRTFFNHFRSKEDSLVGLDLDHAAELTSALVSRPAGETALEAVRAVLTEFALEWVERSDEWALRMDVVRASPELLPRLLGSVSALEQALSEGIAARGPEDQDSGLYPALVSSVALAGMRTAIARWREEQGVRPLAGILQLVFDQIAAGLPASPAGAPPAPPRPRRAEGSTPAGRQGGADKAPGRDACPPPSRSGAGR